MVEDCLYEIVKEIKEVVVVVYLEKGYIGKVKFIFVLKEFLGFQIEGKVEFVEYVLVDRNKKCC